MGDRLGILGAVNLLPFWPTHKAGRTGLPSPAGHGGNAGLPCLRPASQQKLISRTGRRSRRRERGPAGYKELAEWLSGAGVFVRPSPAPGHLPVTGKGDLCSGYHGSHVFFGSECPFQLGLPRCLCIPNPPTHGTTTTRQRYDPLLRAGKT